MAIKNNDSEYFCNRNCEYFPCHSEADPDNFNCLFCYCPLYALGSRCGGNYTYLENGIKDCSSCTFPHKAENYESVISRFSEIADIASENRNKSKQ